MYKMVLANQAVKDARKLEQSGLKAKTASLLRIIQWNPFQTPPVYEKLQGCQDTYSRRINIQHRLIYQGVVKIIRMWTHYE